MSTRWHRGQIRSLPPIVPRPRQDRRKGSALKGWCRRRSPQRRHMLSGPSHRAEDEGVKPRGTDTPIRPWHKAPRHLHAPSRGRGANSEKNSSRRPHLGIPSREIREAVYGESVDSRCDARSVLRDVGLWLSAGALSPTTVIIQIPPAPSVRPARKDDAVPLRGRIVPAARLRHRRFSSSATPRVVSSASRSA
jgi:hypothetical protein